MIQLILVVKGLNLQVTKIVLATGGVNLVIAARYVLKGNIFQKSDATTVIIFKPDGCHQNARRQVTKKTNDIVHLDYLEVIIR